VVAAVGLLLFGVRPNRLLELSQQAGAVVRPAPAVVPAGAGSPPAGR
jgi:hypothetical protein